jgi:hypothetical protein
VRWALEPAPGPRVLELGAGTGKLTAVLVALGAEVIAVEPDPAMLTELPARCRLSVPCRAVARVLVPGGILAGLWNVIDNRAGWVAGMLFIICLLGALSPLCRVCG